MFIGFQKDENGKEFIALVSENKEGITENPFMKFSKWAKTTAPVEFIDGKYYLGSDDIEKAKHVQDLAKAKAERAEAVASINVEVDGMIFDGDEQAQSRMTRAITAADTAGLDSTVWVLADNTVATVTKEQLKQALSKAMLMMSELWTAPYEEQKNEVLRRQLTPSLRK